MSETKLLLCPHCGGKAFLRKGIGEYYDACHVFECRTVWDMKTKVFDAWNRRAGAQWTKEPPTEEGKYWCFFDNETVQLLIRLRRDESLGYTEFGQIPCRLEVTGIRYNNGKKFGEPINEYLCDFVHKYPDALWVKVTPPPLPRKEETKDE